MDVDKNNNIFLNDIKRFLEFRKYYKSVVGIWFMVAKNKLKTRKSVQTLAVINCTIQKSPTSTGKGSKDGGVVFVPSKYIGKCVQIEVIETITLPYNK